MAKSEGEVDFFDRLLQHDLRPQKIDQLFCVNALCLLSVLDGAACLCNNAVFDGASFILRVHYEIIESHHHLTQRKQGGLSLLAELQLDQFVWKWLTGLVMTTQPFENILVPDPVLEHLTGQLAKISLNFRSAEPRVIRIRAHVMHDVAELVEEGGHIHESE